MFLYFYNSCTNHTKSPTNLIRNFLFSNLFSYYKKKTKNNFQNRKPQNERINATIKYHLIEFKSILPKIYSFYFYVYILF